ncbi:bifunctional phosphatase PAP2/diacylglycerol kinase family protein [Nonomuraea sp. NPDC050328]|uniref:bifunctional phosphatase PAP2/diacylglycerol kinase family protein n=1 Tax=Nonomuraea sp. NPDC050328 TaxID=3364361 RepID=UPI0037BB85FA
MRLRSHLNKLDKTLFAAVAGARLPGLEHVLPRLSRAADNALLWAGVSGVLALSGRRRLRRAATRGMLAVGLASPLVNLVGKQAFNRRRPTPDDLPLARLLKTPLSASFPSGHSASAAAFATAVALEAPARIAIPVGLAAAGVCFSRVYTGVHYPGDVLAGAAVGVVTGLLTRRIWPEPGEPGRARAATTAPAAQHDPAGEGLLVLGSPPPALLAALPAARTHQDVRPSEPIPDGVKVLGVAGDDAAVAEAAGLAIGHGVPLLTVPAPGARFPVELGIEDVEEAVSAYRTGDVVAVDVGEVVSGAGRRAFVNQAAFALHPELARRVEAARPAVGTWPALLWSMAKLLRDGAAPEELVIDGVPYRTWLLVAGNCRHEGGGPVPRHRARLEDGLLDIRLLTAADSLPRVRVLVSLVGARLGLSRHYRRWQADTLHVAGAAVVACDGREWRGEGPLVVGKRARALQVLR